MACPGAHSRLGFGKAGVWSSSSAVCRRPSPHGVLGPENADQTRRKAGYHRGRHFGRTERKYDLRSSPKGPMNRRRAKPHLYCRNASCRPTKKDLRPAQSGRTHSHRRNRRTPGTGPAVCSTKLVDSDQFMLASKKGFHQLRT
jgi:hypothetical protein